MKCLFCKCSSVLSKSVEHIVPESLGNQSHILPRGIVCDSCNNYFSRKLEKPILDSGYFRSLRFKEAVPSKRKRIPPQKGFIYPDTPIELFRDLDGKTSVAVPPVLFDKLFLGGDCKLVFPYSGKAPDETLMSRLLAKMALEAVAQISIRAGLTTDNVVDDQQYDPIRNWARKGFPEKSWPFFSRRIYADNCRHADQTGSSWQVIFEYDFLITKRSEWYFCFALFGVEYTINIGGPNLEGYIEWLESNNGASPLYSPRSRTISREALR